MNAAWFIPSALCLLVVLLGVLLSFVATAMILWRRRGTKLRSAASEKAPPMLKRAGSVWIGVALKCFLAFGLVTLLVGLWGVWATGFTISWVANPSREWSAGNAPELEAIIRKQCAPFLRNGKSVGLAVAAVTPTKSTVMSFGRSALSSAAEPRDNTLFELGSITKTFTATVLACEIDRGALRLDEPVQELLPSGVELPEPARGITLRHLTTHTSGFPRLPPNQSPWRPVSMFLFGGDPYNGYAESDLFDAVRTVKLESNPGHKSSYSNFGMTLLGYLLAKTERTNYEALVERDICQPLGMTDTVIQLRDAQKSRFAQGYRAVWRSGPLVLALRSQPWLDRNDDLGGAGGLRSTGADMLKYLRANMHPDEQPIGRALSQTHDELFKESERVSFGMNWIRTTNDTLRTTVIWHNGGTGGFRSFIGFTEDGRFGVLVLSNTSESVDDLSMKLLRALAEPQPHETEQRVRH